MGKRGERALANLEKTVRDHVESGHTAFVVSVYLMEDGTARWKMDRMQEAAQQLLLDMGLRVTGMDYEDWKYTTHFRVEVPPQDDEVKACPRCAETIKAAAEVCRFCGAELADGPTPQWVAMREHVTTLAHALAPLATEDHIGVPFGPGLGLEPALEAATSYFANADELRAAGRAMAVTILAESSIAPSDLDHVMGSGPTGPTSISPEQLKEARDLAGAAKTFLGQLDEPGAPMWELWQRRDDVAGEFLCWHAVAWIRLGTLGRVEPL